MMNNNTEIEESNSTNNGKRPTSLTVLLILSAFYIILSFSGTLQALTDGPFTQVQLEEETAEFYNMITELESNGVGQQLSEIGNVMIDGAVYLNNEAFILHNTLRLFELIIGAIAIVLMFQLKKVGFHFYVAYSIVPIITMYITLPQELIVNVSIIALVLIGAFFSLLYGSNLKHMK